MSRVSIHDLAPGMIVGRAVMTREGRILLESGARLTRAIIVSLHFWGIHSIYIEDGADRARGIPASANPPTAAFLSQYMETIDAVRGSFEHIRRFKEVPIMQMDELADQKVSLLIETVGVLDYLYDIRLHSDYTFQHSLNVAIIAGIVGKWRGCRGQELKHLIIAALLHDIGKLIIPSAVLDKPGKLSESEFELIKMHPREGYRLAKDADKLPDEVRLGILQHHERADGSGYPAGLAGDDIHAFAKVIAIADIYDAMTSDRTYRRRLTPLAALETIAEQMYEKLDTAVCITFLDNMKNHFTGNEVLLSNGQHAKIIILNNKDRFWTKPVVCAPNGELIDLQKEGLSVVDLIQEA